MFARLVKQFSRRGARDHLRGARRLQEEADLHRLFVLTTFHRRDGDGAELVARVMEEGKHLGYDDLKAEVSSNLTDQIVRFASLARDAFASEAVTAAADRGASARSEAIALAFIARLGFAPRLAASTAGPNAGEGLFVRGSVDPGEIVALYPGVVYGPDEVRHMPGFPKVAATNPYLMARYDGSVVDAAPWGFGAGHAPADDAEAIDRGAAFGAWPGPPIDLGDAVPSPKPRRGGMGGWFDETLTPDLPAGMVARRALEAAAVDRRNPLALAHFANHPPEGTAPNVVVAAVDVVVPDAETRRFVPNVGLGSWSAPATRESAAKRRERRQNAGMMGRLEVMFGTEDDGPPERGDGRGRKGGGVTEAEAGGGAAISPKVVPALALVAAESLVDEEVFLNYRLSTHVERPKWYVPVNAEEDARRWASE